MIQLQERVIVPVAADRLWTFLSDPILVASCITGATLEEADATGLYSGKIRVKFGPTVVSFIGEARVTYDDATRSCTVEGRGHDKRGASNASASITFMLTGTDTSVLAVDGGFALTGPLEGFARSGGVHIARLLLRDFAVNIGQLSQATEPAPARTSSQVLDAASVTSRISKDWIAMIFKVTKNWIKGLVSKRNI